MQLWNLYEIVKVLEADLGYAEDRLTVLESRFAPSHTLISVCHAITRWKYTSEF